MSGRGIGDLGRPAKRYRVDLGKNAIRSGFETLEKCRSEDLLRAKKLCRAVAKDPAGFDRKRTLLLAARLRAAGEGELATDNPASSTHMRGQRINVAGAIWKLMRGSQRRAQAFTIIPLTWEFMPDELEGVDPSQLLRTLRTALYDTGAAKARGWLICFIHGEFDPIAGVYRLHVHGYAYDEMVKVIDRLRKLPNYRTQRYLKDGSLSPVYRRVQVKRQKPDNLLRQITYRLQSYWPAKAIVISDDGTRTRAKRKRRIPEPYHTHLLLHMSQWDIADLTLMVGLRVTKAGLRQTNRSS